MHAAVSRAVPLVRLPPALFYSLARRRRRQTSGAGLGTPTLMFVALALRLADHLREITA